MYLYYVPEHVTCHAPDVAKELRTTTEKNSHLHLGCPGGRQINKTKNVG